VGLVVLTAIAALAAYAFAPPPGPRSLARFDAQRVADLELGVWRAYYGREPFRLFALVTSMMREQYHYSWARAATEAFYYVRAAVKFRDIRGNYEDVVLPDLEHGYTTAQLWLHAGFDPSRVARAELAWWVAWRHGNRNNPEPIGRLMAAEYALLYEVPREVVSRAALLRARAAALRDVENQRPDWEEIARLLRESYTDLKDRLSRAAGEARVRVEPGSNGGSPVRRLPESAP
jgi:hypothetical protein